MCTNFDFLKIKKTFSSFANSSIEAEKSLAISPATCAILNKACIRTCSKVGVQF